MADTIMAAEGYYGCDAVYVSTVNYILAEAFGGSVHIREKDMEEVHGLPQLCTDAIMEYTVAVFQHH